MAASASALELIGFAILCFVVAVAGGVAGLVLGNMRLPAAVSISETVAAGGGANVAISAVSAATAATKHIREGRMNWQRFWWLMPTSLAGGFAGGVLATLVSANFLLGFIAVVLFYGSYELFRWTPPAGKVATGPPGRPTPMTAIDKATTALIGLVIGVFGGAVGLILGSLRLPALLRFTDDSPQLLIGTNLSAGVVVGVAGAVGHLTSGSAGFDLPVFLVGAAASIPGAWVGAKLTGRLPTETLVHVIAGIVFVAGLAITSQVIF